MQAKPKLGEATTQPGPKRSIEQMGESSNSNPTKKPRTGDSPILDEVYKGGNKPFKRESVENNIEIPNYECGGDPSPYKTKFPWTDIEFNYLSSIKIPRIEDLNIKLPRIEVPWIEVRSIIFNDSICYLKDMNIEWFGILYLIFRFLIEIICIKICNDPLWNYYFIKYVGTKIRYLYYKLVSLKRYIGNKVRKKTQNNRWES